MRRFFPLGVQLSWGAGLIVASLIIATTGSLAGALAVLGVVVIVGALASQLRDDFAAERDTPDAPVWTDY